MKNLRCNLHDKLEPCPKCAEETTGNKSASVTGYALPMERDEKLDEMAGEIEGVIRKHAENNEITFAGIIGTLELIKGDFKEEAKKA